MKVMINLFIYLSSFVKLAKLIDNSKKENKVLKVVTKGKRENLKSKSTATLKL